MKPLGRVSNDTGSSAGTGTAAALSSERGLALEPLLDRIRSYHPQADVELVTTAYQLAETAHRGQFRDSGESYLKHPLEVAKILADFELDVATISAGLLHDVLEDTQVTRSQLLKTFGEEICHLVDGVTKLDRIPFQSKEEHQAESLRKMFLAMAEDLRVILIKLADRLHNMRTLRHLPPDRQRRVATETIEIYTPLAHRLGMWSLKWEMEDLALRYLDPQGYYDLVHRIAKKRQQREGELREVVKTLEERLVEVGLHAEINGRPKHFYSIYQKMRRQGKEIDEIYDLMAVRVIVDSVKDCYGVVGIVHSLWKPVPGRFKDYVAMPKSNMYQSLHTTVIGPTGEPFEIQLRTWDMHRIAEKGIAAHWMYKEGYKTSRDFETKVAWLRQVVEWLREMKDPKEFMDTLKIDLFEDEVFVFTPKGDVKSLPAGATPLDFAFGVHTDIGMRCVGAKVNGRLVPLDYALKNGEIVEILTAKNAAPSQDWLSFVKTSKARNKIRNWLKEERREEGAERGRELLDREIKRLGLDLHDTLRSDRLHDVTRKYGLSSTDDLYAAVGFGKVTVAQVLGRILGPKELEAKRREWKLSQTKPLKKVPRTEPAVRVKGIDNMLVRFSKCCNPVPGDAIIGYITRGRGVSVHRMDCRNIAVNEDDQERRIAVEWNVVGGGCYPVEIQLEAVDRLNLLTNIMVTVSEDKTNIESVNARTTKDKIALVSLIVNIKDVAHMNSIIGRLRKVEGVYTVQRAHPS